MSQTIEMFEVITQEQPLDYQSLEILKEAYFKLGRQTDVVRTSKRIGQAYVQLGQLSSAILEYESVLQSFPEDPDVVAALAEIESKANSFAGAAAPEAELPPPRAVKPPRGRVVEQRAAPAELEDGRAQMRKLYVEGRLVSAVDFDGMWPKPAPGHSAQVVEPFVLVLGERGLVPVEKSLKLLCEKTRLAYLPIERYDVDVDLARQFPRETCLRWCVLPVDRMSKSILAATVNPYNKEAARELESVCKSRVLWYLCQPAELIKMLRKVFR